MTSPDGVTTAELRRRVRAVETLQMKTRELAAQSVLTTRKTAVEAAVAKETADREAREATAAALRLYDQDSELVADLLGVPAEELERDAKAVTAARAVRSARDALLVFPPVGFPGPPPAPGVPVSGHRALHKSR